MARQAGFELGGGPKRLYIAQPADHWVPTGAVLVHPTRGDVAPCAALCLGQLTTAQVYVNAERVLPCRDSARNPKSQQNGKDDLVAQRLQ